MVAAVSYIAAAVYLGWKPTFGGLASLLSPERTVISFAVMLVVSGFVVGAAASEIRKRVEAALREAETRRQVERLEHDLEVARSFSGPRFPPPCHRSRVLTLRRCRPNWWRLLRLAASPGWEGIGCIGRRNRTRHWECFACGGLPSLREGQLHGRKRVVDRNGTNQRRPRERHDRGPLCDVCCGTLYSK